MVICPLWDSFGPFWAHLEGYRSRGLVCEPKGIFKQIQRAIRARASLREPEGAKESQRECPGVSGGSGGVRGMSRVFGESRDGQHWKKSFINWVQSILVNSILNLRFSGWWGITSLKYLNVRLSFLRMLHGPMHFWSLWCLFRGFIRGIIGLTRHSGLCENAFFGFLTRNLAWRSWRHI